MFLWKESSLCNGSHYSVMEFVTHGDIFYRQIFTPNVAENGDIASCFALDAN